MSPAEELAAVIGDRCGRCISHCKQLLRRFRRSICERRRLELELLALGLNVHGDEVAQPLDEVCAQWLVRRMVPIRLSSEWTSTMQDFSRRREQQHRLFRQRYDLTGHVLAELIPAIWDRLSGDERDEVLRLTMINNARFARVRR